MRGQVILGVKLVSITLGEKKEQITQLTLFFIFKLTAGDREPYRKDLRSKCPHKAYGGGSVV